MGDVVRGRVALLGLADPVVVDRDVGGDVGGPADAERLVLLAQFVPGDGQVGRVLAAVDESVGHVPDVVVIDPDVVGAVHLDAVEIVFLVVPDALVGVPDRQVPDDHVVDALAEEEAAADDLSGGPGPDDRLVRLDLDLLADRIHGDRGCHDDDVRLTGGRVLLQVGEALHGDGLAVPAAVGAVLPQGVDRGEAVGGGGRPGGGGGRGRRRVLRAAAEGAQIRAVGEGAGRGQGEGDAQREGLAAPAVPTPGRAADIAHVRDSVPWRGPPVGGSGRGMVAARNEKVADDP
ncbi:hypothetical protein QF032_003706 [Streptomyces achromogenes]|nr:hypothetical protein [Streptomyces achromogenes]